ncbi:MAG: hypothetical protein JXA52_03020 [Planctomycetes bacterium]|nr:hypothetical protein [Planctomycetota bacterium]
MGQVKLFLLAHAEKLVLAIVAIFAIWSIAANIFSDANQGFDPDKISANISRIDSHLKKDERWIEIKDPETADSRVETILQKDDTEIWLSQGWDAPLYVSPPARNQRTRIPIIEDYFAPPMAYISRIDMPTNLHVKAGAGRVAIVFQEGPLTQWREGVSAAIFRKAVGMGREDADMDKVYQRQRERAGELPAREGSIAPGAPPAPGGMPPPEYISPSPVYDPNRGLMIPPGGRSPGMTIPSVGPGLRSNQDEDMLSSEERLAKIRVEKNVESETIKTQEEAAKEDLEALLDKEIKIEEKWEEVVRDLKGIEVQPDIDAVLTEAAIAKTNPLADETAPDRKWFYFLDKNVKENTIYRYRVVVYAKPKNLPEEVIENADTVAKKKAEDKGKTTWIEPYKYYYPILRMGNLRLALPPTEFGKYLNDEPASGSAEAVPLKFEDLEYQQAIVKDAEGNTIDWWSLPAVGSDPTPEDVWKKLSTAIGFSQFAWSDYVLTPINTKFELKTVMTGQASIEVEIVDSTGKQRSQRCLIQLPELPPNTQELYLNVDNQAAMTRMYRGITPAPIGEEKSLGSTTYDFRTGWGLVDIRKCEITIARYTWVDWITRTKQSSSVTPISEPKESEWEYMVICELEGRGGLPRRYKAQIRDKKLRETPQYYEEIIKIDWNPGKAKP